MSSVQELRRRLLLEQLEQWVQKLSREEPVEPEEVQELAVRLLAMTVMLLKQHQVNKRGQCPYCRRRPWNWRSWKRRPQCTVGSALGFVMSQEPAVVWWRLLGSVGKQASLEEVRGGWETERGSRWPAR